jgi:hypothetical protein
MSKAVLARVQSAIVLPPSQKTCTAPLMQALQLRIDQRIVFAQTVGYTR